MGVARYGFTGEGGIEIDIGSMKRIKLCLSVCLDDWICGLRTCNFSSRKSWLHRAEHCFQ